MNAGWLAQESASTVEAIFFNNAGKHSFICFFH
jgi:hypothetical protein